MDLKKGITFHHHHISLGLIFIILLIIVLVLLIKPALTGYSLNKELEDLGTSAADVLRRIDLVKSEKLVVETNLENCKKLNEDYLGQVTDEKSDMFSCIEEKKEVESKLEQQKKECEFEINRVTSENAQKKSTAELELEQLKVTFAGLESSYNSLSDNSANNICCKNKIDSPEIDSYFISGGKIVCSVGSEDKISC